jgi:hypothetical protein
MDKCCRKIAFLSLNWRDAEVRCGISVLKGRFWKSFSWCIYNYMESIGTKAFTRKEIVLMLSELPVENIKIESILTYYDKLKNHNKFLQIVAKLLFTVLNSEKIGWFLTIDFDKK